MGNFNTILAILGTVLAAAMAQPQPHSAGGPCRNDAEKLAAAAKAEPDWLKREVAFALLAEARHEAAHGRETSCLDRVNSARAELNR